MLFFNINLFFNGRMWFFSENNKKRPFGVGQINPCFCGPLRPPYQINSPYYSTPTACPKSKLGCPQKSSLQDQFPRPNAISQRINSCHVTSGSRAKEMGLCHRDTWTLTGRRVPYRTYISMVCVYVSQDIKHQLGTNTVLFLDFWAERLFLSDCNFFEDASLKPARTSLKAQAQGGGRQGPTPIPPPKKISNCLSTGLLSTNY